MVPREQILEKWCNDKPFHFVVSVMETFIHRFDSWFQLFPGTLVGLCFLANEWAFLPVALLFSFKALEICENLWIRPLWIASVYPTTSISIPSIRALSKLWCLKKPLCLVAMKSASVLFIALSSLYNLCPPYALYIILCWWVTGMADLEEL